MTVRRPRTIVRIVAPIAAAALALAGCSSSGGGSGGSGGDPKVIKIGILTPSTGANALQGGIQLAGAQIAVDDINAAGGIKALGGAKLELVHQDGGTTAADSTTAVQALLNGNNLVAMIGTGTSTNDLAIQPIMEQHKVPMLDTVFADKLTDGTFKYTFVMPPAQSTLDSIQYPAIEAAAKSAGINLSRVAIISGTNPTNVASAKDVRNIYAKKYGWNIVIDQTIQIGTMTGAPLSNLVAQIKTQKPQVLFIGLTLDDVVAIQRQELAEGMTPVPWLLDGAPFLSQPFYNALGTQGTNGVFAIDSVSVNPKSEAIVKEMQAKGQKYVNQFNLGSYSEIYIIAQALEDAKSTNSTQVRNAIAALNLTSGNAAAVWPCDCVKFSSDGRAAEATGVLRQWQNGAIVDVYPTNLANGKAVWPANGS